MKKWVILLLFLLAAALRFYHLEKPATHYFDEVYFVFTSQEWVKGNRPWDYQEPAPKGKAYEWTHPHLGKELTAVSIAVLGDHPYAWRFMQACFGCIGLVAIYFLALALFEKGALALFAALLYSFDTFPLAMSRMGTSDIFLMSFILLATLFFVKYTRSAKKSALLLSALFCGAAVSVKWNGAMAPLFLLTAGLWTAPKKKEVIWSYLMIPPAVYLLSYLPFFLSGHGIQAFINLQKSMYTYHKGLAATHPYSSQWWTWPLMWRPVYLSLEGGEGVRSHIYAFGNPWIWWTGGLSLVLTPFEIFSKKSRALLFTFLSALAYWLPWSLSPRSLTFIYHYLPSLPFVYLMIAYYLDLLWQRGRIGKFLAASYLVVAAAVFIFFLPIALGWPLEDKSLPYRFWLESWR